MHSPGSLRRGFSLVELSIVLVILGLLTGGILAGQSLIRAAELRTMLEQQKKFITATQTFRDKYFALPGDMTNASKFWGLSADCTAQDTGTLTCDGNGDGNVRSLFSPNDMTTGALAGSGNNEASRFWQHLATAGLIEGKYNGIDQEPPSRVQPTATWHASDLANNVSGRSNMFDGPYKNTLSLVAQLSPQELWNIDTKADDGKPGAGKIFAYVGPALFTTPNLGACTTASSAPYGANLAVDYLLSGTQKVCGPIFLNAF